MDVPAHIQKLIESECSRNRGTGEFIALVRRKDSPLDVETTDEQGERGAYDVLPESKSAKILQDWYAFYNSFPMEHSSFRTFYSKSEFCLKLQRQDLPKAEEQAQKLFLALLADRKFFFLEFNEHLSSPEYPPLSEIVRKPDLYSAETEQKTRDHAQKVMKQGFVPTYAHWSAYKEAEGNYEDLVNAISERKRCITKEREGSSLEQLYQAVSFKIEPFNGVPSPLEDELCSLFRDFILASTDRAYIKRYKALADEPLSNYLPAVHGLLSYADRNGLMPYLPLLFFHLFTQKTVKLARGTLKKYQFAAIGRRGTNIYPDQAQIITRMKIENNIILFDLLLQVFSSEDPSFLKYLFHQYTQYHGYNHFDVSLNQKERFLCLPNPRDNVDQLVGTFRFHIRYCIPNEVNWLTPGLPNEWRENSEALATFLLRDAAFLPVHTRLTDRVRRCLNDSKDTKAVDRLTLEYREACMDQEETIQLLDRWCAEYKLTFIGEDIAPHFLQKRPEPLQQICSRFVLEHALKEKIYSSARENLFIIAQSLFGPLCVDGEAFYLPSEQ